MKIDDLVYFAPDVHFYEVDFDGPDLPDLIVRRIGGFYLNPARILIDEREAFGAGLILVTCIDAMARLKIGGKVGTRFQQFVQDELPSFASPGLSKRFYDDFRNGLVHEARVKSGGHFSLQTPRTLRFDRTYMVVNPKFLLDEVNQALKRYSLLLRADAAELPKLAKKLKADHAEDVRAAKVRPTR
jgi:hypothetical protein